MAVVLDLLVAYLFFILARVAFLVENRTLFADTLADGNLARIFRGGLLFDTSAIFRRPEITLEYLSHRYQYLMVAIACVLSPIGPISYII